MSHDTDKLIRQLSLVAFLMAELRPLTARDIKGNVEGYQEMSDEAFARRFYSDRAELVGLGVPLDSQRDEHTGEELYTLRSERYFLPPLELDDDELAALQTCLYLLEGRFAYAEPLRLALQNLALGRSSGARDGAPTSTAVRVEVRDPDYTPELQGRLGKLEGAITKQRTVRFQYWSIARDDERERTINPYALLPENGTWYMIGEDQGDKRSRASEFPGSAPRSASPPGASATFVFRRASTSRTSEAGPTGSSAIPSGRHASSSHPTRPGGCAARTASRAVTSTATSSSPSTHSCRCSRAGYCARTGARCRSARPSCASSCSKARRPRSRPRRAHPGAGRRGSQALERRRR